MSDSFSKYDVYAVAGSSYCYRDSGVLKNRFGLRDKEKLRKLEADISAIRQNELLIYPIQGFFTANHLCKIHRHLLGDIYPFAGHFRREDIMKGTTRFLSYQQIKPKLTKLLRELAEEDHFRNYNFDSLVERSAYYFAELNYIHPFREGNGRATREFMRQLFATVGYDVDWGAVPRDTLMSAMEESVFDISSLKTVLRTCLIPQSD